MFVPVFSGDGIYGIWKGFRELAERGVITKTPVMIACQPEGADSLFQVWRPRCERVKSLQQVTTAALSVGEPETGAHALRAIYQSSGEVMTATEEETWAAYRNLQRKGLALELASALAFACLERRQRTALGMRPGLLSAPGLP